MYDPVLKRFLDTDPAGQGFSPYAYVLNNPVMYIDPTGMSIDQWFRDLFDGIVMGFGIMTDFFSDTFGLYPQYYHEEILVTANRPENINSDSFYPESKVFYLDNNYNLPSQDRVVNQFNPLANAWGYVTYVANGTDRLGNKMSHFDGYMAAFGAASLVPVSKSLTIGNYLVKTGAAKSSTSLVKTGT